MALLKQQLVRGVAGASNNVFDAIVNFLKISVSELTVMKNSSRNGAQKKCSSLSQVEAIESLLTGTLN